MMDSSISDASTTNDIDKITTVNNKVNVLDEIDIFYENLITPGNSNQIDHRNDLMANLYATIEFLKAEILEKNIIIKSLLDNQYVLQNTAMETRCCNKNSNSLTSYNTPKSLICSISDGKNINITTVMLHKQLIKAILMLIF